MTLLITNQFDRLPFPAARIPPFGFVERSLDGAGGAGRFSETARHKYLHGSERVGVCLLLG